MISEIEHFFNCISKSTKPKTDGSYAQKIVKILENIEKSISN